MHWPRGTAVRPSAAALAASLALLGCARDAGNQGRSAARGRPDGAFPVRVHRPASLESIAVDNGDGGLLTLRCEGCHALFRDDPPALPSRAEDLGGPHAGLALRHGDIACASCHDPARYDRLRLASGESIPMTDAMRLCRQCHGPQARDYDHGSHGGMRGHWDLARGPRERNHCVDCHDPHAPGWGQHLPAPPPRDTARTHRSAHE